MEIESMIAAVFPALEDIYRFLAIVVALYFPLAMLTWLVIDKLHKTGDERIDVRSEQPSRNRGHFTLTHDPRRNS